MPLVGFRLHIIRGAVRGLVAATVIQFALGFRLHIVRGAERGLVAATVICVFLNANCRGGDQHAL